MKQQIFILVLVIGIIVRSFHLGESMESPHLWRQSDTANYIWDFYENGINVFKPSVCWMGNHKTLILEFPLVEAIIAFFYHIFGPSHTVAKIIILLFFLGSCYYFFKIINRFLNKDLARLIVLIYLFAPLSQFYSRAVHIDYAEMFFVFGMVHFYLKGIKEKNLLNLIVGSLFAVLSFIIKAPYSVLFAIPLLGYILKEKRLLYTLKVSYVFIVPILIFAYWQHYVFTINDAAPNWFYLSGYRKFTYNSGWYYGSFSQRLDVANWILLKDRLLYEILGYTGLIFTLFSLFFVRKTNYFFLLWGLGTVVYLLVFFNLNKVHNYYQIPFVPIFSVFIGLGVYHFGELLKKTLIKKIVVVSFSLVYVAESTYYAENNYYSIQYLHQDIGNIIHKNTNNNDLVIINFENFDSKCPNFLYAAKRKGWGLPEWGLKPNVVYKLMKEGANYFVSVRKDNMSTEMNNFLKFYPIKKYNLRDGFQLYIYEINFKYIEYILPLKDKEEIKRKGLL